VQFVLLNAAETQTWMRLAITEARKIAANKP